LGAWSLRAPLYASGGTSGLLFHGPQFQLVEHIDGLDASARTAAARVSSTVAAGWSGRFVVDAAALDAGLQLLLLWARHATGGAFLPTAVGALVMHSHVPARGSLTCVLRGKAPPDLKAAADLAFVDDRGRVLFELLGVEAHRLPSDDAFVDAPARVDAAE